MPKNKIYKIEINKEIFTQILKQKKVSIKKLGSEELAICNERTIRRALNEGKISPNILNKVAKYLDVDPRLLSGELHKKGENYPEDIRSIYLSSLKTLDKYKYFNKVQAELQKQPIRDFLEKLLSLFSISISQFNEMDFEEQYCFQYDLFNSIRPVIIKYFKVDGFGHTDLPDLDKILIDLENYKDTYYEHLYADTILRERYISAPPPGLNKRKIQAMTPDELIALDLDMKFNN